MQSIYTLCRYENIIIIRSHRINKIIYDKNERILPIPFNTKLFVASISAIVAVNAKEGMDFLKYTDKYV